MKAAADLLAEAWALAGTVEHAGDRRAVRLGGGSERSWATLADNGVKGVLVEAPAKELLGPTVTAILGKSQALRAEIFAFADEGRSTRGLLLECPNHALMPAFVGFCEPFLARAEQGEPVGSAFAACIEEFTALLAAEEGEGDRSGLGLLGELIVLHDLSLMRRDSVRFWARPQTERHDFRNGKAAIEVKASLRARAAKPVVRINALDQLEPPAGGELFLALVRLERDPGGLLSRAQVTAAIRAMLDADTRSVLDAKMAAFPFNGTSEASYELIELAYFRVGHGFPHLTPASLKAGKLPPGIANVGYDIDLSAAAQCRCSSSVASAALGHGGAPA